MVDIVILYTYVVIMNIPSTYALLQIWKIAKQKIQFSRALMAGNWLQAEASLQALAPLVPEHQLYSAELQFRKGNFGPARSLLKDIIDEYDRFEPEKSAPRLSKEVLVRSLILLSEIQVICSDPGKQLLVPFTSTMYLTFFFLSRNWFQNKKTKLFKIIQCQRSKYLKTKSFPICANFPSYLFIAILNCKSLIV